jgi:pSer/pThr/pTyr-binding forkhead associated (FHA) protein
MCGEIFSGVGKEQKKELITESVGSKSSMKGTVIQSVSSDKDFGDKERRKLTGFLISYSRSPNGTFFPLYEGKNSIGRGESSQICIQGDPNVSEKHLSVLYRTVDRKFKFKDEQSSNGTFINEELIDEGELKNLDKIRIGETRMLFMEIPLTAFE